jgi:tetratricopeptide (TPR) repeat protein
MSMELIGWNDDIAYLISQRAYLLHTEGHYRESLVLFEGLLEIYPEELYYRDAVSALHLSLKNFDEAIRHASFIIKMDPTYTNAFVKRCEGYLSLGMISEAERDLEQVKALRASGIVRRMEMRVAAAKRIQLMQTNHRLEQVKTSNTQLYRDVQR